MLNSLRYGVRALRARVAAARYSGMPLQQIFEDIYSGQRWGSGGREFDSGSGSVDAVASPYVDAIARYVADRGVRSIVDLGCGDFRVGSAIVAATGVRYTGVDIARPLIEHLRSTAANTSVDFQCLNLVEDPLPVGDLYLIRQVLQHLSNQQIATILGKLQTADTIVTEHIPIGPGIAWNKDKAAGPDVRLYRKSGVFLEHPPFSLPLETLLEVPQPFNGVDAVLRTSLLRARLS